MTTSHQTAQLVAWMMLGERALKNRNFSEAEMYFEKIIDVDAHHWQAIYLKGKASAEQSLMKYKNFPEFYQTLEQAVALIEPLNLPVEDKAMIYNGYVRDAYYYNNLRTDLKGDKFQNQKNLFIGRDERKVSKQIDRLTENIQRTEFLLQLIDAFEDEESVENKLRLKKRICQDLVQICFSMHLF